MQIGDIVVRISHSKDIVFKINSIDSDIAILSGVFTRLVADAPISDLIIIDSKELELRKNNEDGYKRKIVSTLSEVSEHVTGKILHYDSDIEYLNRCLDLYHSLGIYAKGKIYKECDMEKYILKDIYQYRPNIVIITGHDSYNKKGLNDLKNYKNTLFYMKTVLKIRESFPLDDLCVFAGACGSNFEALIASGANFASSVNRDNIEAYDPAIIGILCAITPIDTVIDCTIIKNISKMEKNSIGGIESYGKMRLLIR